MKIKKLFLNLGFQILLSMIIGIAVGALMGKSADIFQPLGDLFIQLIKMLVIPLVFISIISGSASLGATKSAGKMGAGTMAFFMGTTAIAVCIALFFGYIFKPGEGLNLSEAQSMLGNTAHQLTAPAKPMNFWDTLMGIIPENPIQALTTGNILQIIFFGLFLGIGISTLATHKKQPILNGLNYITEALIWMIKIVMATAPIGVFGLMAAAIGNFGFDLLGLVAELLLVFLLCIAIVGLGLFPLSLKLFSKINIAHFMREMTKPQIVAFSTASSMATLPVNMDVCETKLGVSKETSSFVLPLGATINMAGNAIYYALVAMFFAQMYGIELNTSHYIAIILTSTVGSIGQAGVPGPTLLVVAVLVAADIPISGLPLLYALDRVFDMIRTSLNITGDAACAVIMDRFNTK